MSYISGNFKYILKQNIKVQNGYAKKLLLVRAYDLKSVHWFSSLKCGNRKRVLLFVNPIALSTDKQFVTAVLGRAVRHALKLRYWVLGGAVGGGVQASRRYEEWKDSLPDMGWIKELIPEQEKMDEYYNYFQKYKNMMNLPEKGWLKDVINKAQIKTKDLAEWLDENSSDGDITSVLTEGLTPEYATVSISNFKIDNVSSVGIMSATASPFSSKPQTQGTDKLVDDALQIQIKYQKEIDRLEKENRELRKQLLLKYPKSKSKKKFKKSLIDLYSEVLDELSDYDSNYDTQDHLPRVVVVGDQSSGKTSVLEMVAKARIFPRGSGEMMTRAPVKVTLSEGPYHVAQFNDSTREYDLTVESELAELRNDVEMRMKRSVGNGKTVSNQVISMSVKGPGIQRMVLVDLPGIISTVTVDMAADTRESIREMSKVYMSNPNAIILCIQDGSVDAERSNVTELVSQVDPHGKRTILVLTKVDLAEENLANPDRIKKILQGKLFPMKALGNFAVVTGRGNSTDSIDTIKKYEEEYFSNSKLFKDGLISTSQLTTQSLSFAVAECFWKMVKESIEQQADAFKASRFNLETEWKHNFPRERELDRDELFEKARSEILDEVASLSLISAKDWENALSENIWEKISTYVFNDIYFPTAQCDSPGVYNMTVDIKLRQWAEELLPTKCIDVGSKTLMFWFKKLLTNTKLNSKEDQIFNLLKLNIIKQVMDSHQWESKGLNTLRILQLNSLEDQTIGDKQQWDDAVKFLDTSLHDMIKSTDQRIREMIGPSSYQRWTNWQYQREDEKKNAMIKQELEKLLKEDYLSKHGAELGNDEVTMVKKNLQTQKVQVDTLAIKQVWHPVYRMYFLKKAAEKVNECRKCFYLYQQGLDAEIDCNDIILFGRILRMLNVTTNTLRQQLVNREARQIEKIIKDILDKLSEDEDLKKELITGRRVELAEELKQVRRIQDKLEEFIQALNLEK